MANKPVRFSEILGAIQGRGANGSGFSAGFGELQASRRVGRKLTRFLGSGPLTSTKLKKNPNARKYASSVKKALKEMGYTDKQITEYVYLDNPVKAGISSKKTTERVINHLRRQGVAGFKEMDKLSSGSDYGRRMVENILDQRKQSETSKSAVETVKKESTDGQEKKAPENQQARATTVTRQPVPRVEQKSDSDADRARPIIASQHSQLVRLERATKDTGENYFIKAVDDEENVEDDESESAGHDELGRITRVKGRKKLRPAENELEEEVSNDEDNLPNVNDANDLPIE